MNPDPSARTLGIGICSAHDRPNLAELGFKAPESAGHEPGLSVALKLIEQHEPSELNVQAPLAWLK